MGWLFNYLQTFLITAAVVLCVVWWRGVLRLLRRGWSWVARRRAAVVVIPAVISLVLSVWLARQRFPLPGIHDEFSYLLGGDTFAHGRLTNPPHAMWEHFETMHVIQHPTYASKYPPGQAMSLALGQLLWKPLAGVWIGTALAAAAVAWMLLAFVPRRWALLGGVLTAAHPQLLGWGQSYWGGGVAMLGGALILGAVGRLAKDPRAKWGVVLAVGMAILANTRPYEGLILSLAAGGLCLAWSRDRLLLIRRAAPPVVVVLVGAAACMGYYHFRVTNNPLVMPYMVHEATYGSTPVFVWQSPGEIPLYRNRVLWEFWARWAVGQYEEHWLSFKQVYRHAGERWDQLKEGMFPTVWAALPLLMLPLVHLRKRRMRHVEIAILFFVVATMIAVYFSPAYFGPAVAMVVLLYVQCLRYVAAVRVKRFPAGQLLLALSLCAFTMMTYSWAREHVGRDRRTWRQTRARLVTELSAREGKDLVIVRYGRGHKLHEEWVYNGADVDAAPVVFARDLGAARNAPLLRYFKDRRAWLLTPEAYTHGTLPPHYAEVQMID